MEQRPINASRPKPAIGCLPVSILWSSVGAQPLKCAAAEAVAFEAESRPPPAADCAMALRRELFRGAGPLVYRCPLCRQGAFCLRVADWSPR